MTDDNLRRTMLFDFFGDLLTDKQREYYDLYHNEDLSLAEIAAHVGITRQGVYDIVTRAESILDETERKTGIIERFTQLQSEIAKAIRLADEIKNRACEVETASLAARLSETLEALKG